MDEDWRNTFGIFMCKERCDGAGAGICDGASSTCSSCLFILPPGVIGRLFSFAYGASCVSSLLFLRLFLVVGHNAATLENN